MVFRLVVMREGRGPHRRQGMEMEECVAGGWEKKALMGRRRMKRQRPVKWSCGGRGRNWAAGSEKGGGGGEQEGRMEGRAD